MNGEGLRKVNKQDKLNYTHCVMKMYLIKREKKDKEHYKN